MTKNYCFQTKASNQKPLWRLTHGGHFNETLNFYWKGTMNEWLHHSQECTSPNNFITLGLKFYPWILYPRLQTLFICVQIHVKFYDMVMIQFANIISQIQNIFIRVQIHLKIHFANIISQAGEHFLSVSGVERMAPPPPIPWSEIFAGDYTSRPNTVKHYFLQCNTISIVSLEL